MFLSLPRLIGVTVLALSLSVVLGNHAFAQGRTTVCQFNSGPRAGTTFDFAPYGVAPIPVGQPCTDGQGSNGISIASSGGGMQPGGGGMQPGNGMPPGGGGGMTTVCRFTSGTRAGTTFDFAPYGIAPIPVGQPCTDGQGSNGTSIARQ